LEKLDKLGLIEDSDGARVIFVDGVDIPLIAVKKDGGYNYFSTDLASLWLVFSFSILDILSTLVM
jgi:arginyl-tRNA synthetase